MKYYVEQIAIGKDGVSAHAITEKNSKEEAISEFHSIMASAIVNPNVISIHVEAKNELGEFYKTDNFVRKVEEPVVEKLEEEAGEVAADYIDNPLV